MSSVSSSTLSRTCRNCAHEIDMANRFKTRPMNRPTAIGNSKSKRQAYSDRLLVISDDSEDDVLFDPKKSTREDEEESTLRVGSLVRKFELTGESRGGSTGSKRRSRSFSEIPV